MDRQLASIQEANDFSHAGESYGKVIVNYTYLKQLIDRRRTWANVTCKCGNTFDVVYGDLKNGTTKSCGCHRRDRMKEVNYKHGAARKGQVTKEFRAWDSMIKRTTRPNHEAYKDYGGRGIGVCDRWMQFDNFYFDMGPCPEGYSLDRIDNNSGYELNNCRWADFKTQSRNKRNNRWIEYAGKEYILADLSKLVGLSRGCLSKRLDSGIPIEIAVSYPSRKHERSVPHA